MVSLCMCFTPIQTVYFTVFPSPQNGLWQYHVINTLERRKLLSQICAWDLDPVETVELIPRQGPSVILNSIKLHQISHAHKYHELFPVKFMKISSYNVKDSVKNDWSGSSTKLNGFFPDRPDPSTRSGSNLSSRFYTILLTNRLTNKIEGHLEIAHLHQDPGIISWEISENYKHIVSMLKKGKNKVSWIRTKM